jgi:VanZ family protein
LKQNLKWIKLHGPWIIYMIMITVESSMSDLTVPDLGISFTDKIIHFGLYGLLGWLLARGFNLADSKYPVLLPIVIGMVFAVSDELHQAFVPGRDADVFDVMADFLGILAFVFLYRWFVRRFTKVAA